MPGYDSALGGIPFNPTQALADLKTVDSDPTKLNGTITLTYPSDSPDGLKVAAQMQSDYSTYLHVDIKVLGEPFNQLVPDIQTFKLQFYLIAWIADYPDPQDWLSGQFTSGANGSVASANNDQNFVDPNFDKLAVKADVDLNPTERLSLYNQMEELAVDEVAWIPFSQSKNLYVVAPYVKGFVIDAGGITPPDAWPSVQIMAH